MPKIGEIKAKYDVVFQPQFRGAEISEWTEADHTIPSGVQPYYLQANSGPTYLLGGVMSRPFITTQQNNANFAITSIESSRKLGSNVLEKGFAFNKVHQVYTVLDGSLSISLDGKQNEVRAGDTVFIPAGTRVGVRFVDNYVRFWSFTSGDALNTLISEAGREYEGKLVPNKPEDIDVKRVAEIAERIGLQIEV